MSQGLGKGVLFFETNSQAAPFLKYSDILSADDYWLTDQHNLNWVNGACDLAPGSSACGGGRGPGLNAAEAELPANYYWNVTRLATLQARNGSSKPVVVDVETGCPGVGRRRSLRYAAADGRRGVAGADRGRARDHLVPAQFLGSVSG